MKTVQGTRAFRSRWAIGKLFLYLPLVAIACACLVPFVVVLSASFTDEATITRQGFSLVPQKLSLFAYQYLFSNPSQILSGYGVTVTVTLVGGALSMVIMSLLAYSLSRPEMPYRRVLSFYVFFTMLFSAGLVPVYILVTQYLHLGDTVWALIVPLLVTPFNVLLLRTFFNGLPGDLFAAARIDGASEFRTFWQIALPLARPALATVSLFVVLMYWNDYFQALLYTSDTTTLLPLQYLLYALLTNAQAIATSPDFVSTLPPTESLHMAEAIIAIGPIAFAALFVQRYFVRGITVGALRE